MYPTEGRRRKRGDAIATTLAIVALAVVEWKAITLGMDGWILSLVVAAISGLGGFSISRLVRRP